MEKTVWCAKLKQELPGFSTAPYPGALGARIMADISQEAWKLWLAHQTMLINEYRLNLMDAESRRFLSVEMEKFFFGEGSEKPAQFVEVPQ
jgi:Fe-S cluster biosynthesis and repair protein YggX